MTKASETVVFFGSGPVAAEALRQLLKDFSVEAVVTKPNLKARPGELTTLDVAKANDVAFFTPANRSELDNLIDTKPFKSQVAVLIDYGIIVSQKVIDYFPLGIINSHFSLLPLWRGADPITFAILSGDKQTGVSLMLINAQMDEGLLLAQAQIELDQSIDSPTLTDKLLVLSHSLIQEYLPKYLSGKLKPYEQPTNIKPTYSRKLTKQDGEINWLKPAIDIDREIRAYLVWPKSYTKIGVKEIIVTKAHVLKKQGQSGNIVAIENEIIAYCSRDALSIDELKPAGKLNMNARAFLAGYRKLF